MLVDLKSTHGTFVNGDRVDRRPLRNRDVICLGPGGVEIVFLERGPDEPAHTSNSLLESDITFLLIQNSSRPSTDSGHKNRAAYISKQCSRQYGRPTRDNKV